MSREVVKRLHIDGTAYWVPMDTIKPLQRPRREELIPPLYDDTTSTAAGSCPRLIMVRTSSMIP